MDGWNLIDEERLLPLLRNPEFLRDPKRFADIAEDAPAEVRCLLEAAAALHRGATVDPASLDAANFPASTPALQVEAHRLRSHTLARCQRLLESAEEARLALDLAPADFPGTNRLQMRTSFADRQRGDYRTASQTVRQVYVQATNDHDEVTANIALAHLAIYSFEQGDLRRADALAQQVCNADETKLLATNPGVMSLALVVRAQVAALRGTFDEATQLFDQAARVAEDHAPWTTCIVAYGRGISLMQMEVSRVDWHEAMCHESPWAAADLTWMRDHVRGLQFMDNGQTDEGFALLESARTSVEGAWERARIDLHLGEALILADKNKRAVSHLRVAHDVFSSIGAPYWLARTCVALARSEPKEASGHLAMAHTLDDGDPAYELLPVESHRLSIDVGEHPTVRFEDEPVLFHGRQAEFAVYALVVAGEQGLSVTDLADVLWPSPAPNRVPQRMRTLWWQVRSSFGPHAWRVQRRDGRIWLDLRSVEVTGLPADSTEIDRLLAGWDHLGDAPRSWLQGLARSALDAPST